MQSHKTLYLGGGCFWCTEAIFQELKGVLETVPGYMGGTVPQPSYEAVCEGTTGHAEVIKVYYDEQVISTGDILDIFFETHDPTTLNRQGNDVGSQYRSVIFYTDDTQREEIRKAVERAQRIYTGNIVTEAVSATEFYPAEEYHYNYYQNNTTAPYCSIVISPKLEKLRKRFGDKVEAFYK
jgi:peptide-methionine (S)-S-oxide reductase